MLTFYCHPQCTTCRKARRWLDERAIAYNEVNLKQSAPEYSQLKEWVSISQIPIRRFFNTSGQLYRELGLKDKLINATEDEQLHFLATDGMLVKRPILVGSGVVMVGFKPDEWNAALT